MASTNLKMLSITGNNKFSDECYTPEQAIKPLIKYLKKDKIYYDCTSGISSNIVDFLNNNDFKCLSSGSRNFINDNDLFGKNKMPNFDVLITNPPYSKKDKFIEKCYKLKKPFALLLPVSSIQGKKRGYLFNKFGIELLVLNNRVDFTGKSSPHFGVAWFCYKILNKDLIFVDNEK